MRIERIEPHRVQKKCESDPDVFNPFEHEGPAANVFNIEIDFLQIKNVQSNHISNQFEKRIFVPKFHPEEVCRHGNRYSEKESMICVESTKMIIHHTTDVNTQDKLILYRPTVYPPGCCISCQCKQFYTGEDDQLLRVSSAKNKMTGQPRTLHFVSVEYYFSFLGQLLFGGETMSAFIKSRKFVNEIYFGNDKSPEHKKVLQKGFEMFCHALKFKEDSNYCYDCPQSLQLGEKEDDFKNDIEYSIIDGIQMGCRTNNLKAEIKEDYFKEELVEGIHVKGVEAKDRTFLNKKSVRTIIKNLLAKVDEPNALVVAVRTLHKSELDLNSRSVLELLHRILSEGNMLPKGYISLLLELQLETPISALMTPYTSDRQVYSTFMDYLNNKMDLFDSPSTLEIFINKFPVIIDCIKNILEAENTKKLQNLSCLPTDVSAILRNMIRLRFNFDKLSQKVAVPRISPKSDFVPPLADVFPSYPIHTKENIYKADKKPETSETDECEKDFQSSNSMSGGIGTVSCNHKITKGFRAIRKGGSPVIFCHSLLRRIPGKVQAHKRVVVYDFACRMHKTCLRRYPYRIRRFQFVIDRYHQSNHTYCSQAYKISKYPDMNHVNTQIAEQLNNSLRKLSTVVAYSNFQTYLKIIEISLQLEI